MTSDRRLAFANAFAAQGRSDWEVYRHLAGLDRPRLPWCHALHYLQMATEKIAKAYRIRDTQAELNELMRHHTGFERFVNAFFSSPTIRSEYRGRDEARESTRKNIAALAREIEKLAPAVDSSISPENAEYPWERDGKVVRPCEYEYPLLSLLKTTSGRALVNMVDRAFRDFEALRIP